jgi:hypothetical protein
MGQHSRDTTGYGRREMDYVEAMETIAQAAIEWRKALYGGRFDKAASKLESLALITDDYLQSVSSS